mgnify:FL=1
MKHSYLLDDPLSAVDAHVGRSLFRNCIRGLLRSKCVLLVTHALEYLPACDNIVVIEKGMIQDQGSYTHVSANQNGVLAGLLKAQKEAKAQSVSPITPLSPLSPIESEGVEKLQSDSVSTSMMIDDQTGTTDGVMCDTTITDVSADIPTDPTTTDPPTNDSSTTQTGELITEETRITGTVNRSVYSMYLQLPEGFG